VRLLLKTSKKFSSSSHCFWKRWTH